MNRSENVKNNIIYSSVLKILSIGISFLLIPLTVNYLTNVEYGIWITLYSIMSWINFLDVGLGLGLRNKLSEAVSKNNLEEIKTNLSTGIISISFIGVVFLLLFLFSINFIKMQTLFNTNLIRESELYLSVLITGCFVILSFVFSIINQIYYAYQKAAFTGMIQILNNFIMLILIYYLTLKNVHNLIYFIFCFGFATIFSKSLFIICFFYQHRELVPKIKFFKRKALEKMLTLGINFLFIQICSLLISSSSSFFITQILGPEYVRDYDICFKIFSFITMAHTLVCTPLWNAYTDAYIKKDYNWILKTIKKLVILMIPICIISIMLMLSINSIIKIWINSDIQISLFLIIVMGIYVIVNSWMNIWSYFLNGIGNIKIQMYVYIFATLICIPSGCYLMKYIGNVGMILGISIALFIIGMVLFIQSLYILKSMKEKDV